MDTDEPRIVWQGTAGVDPEDFRRRHLGEWAFDPSTQAAHDAWEAYDYQATTRELWFKDGRRLAAPRMLPMPDPDRPGMTIGSFESLFEHHVRRGYQKLMDEGWEGSYEDFRARVKQAGRNRPPTLDERYGRLTPSWARR